MLESLANVEGKNQISPRIYCSTRLSLGTVDTNQENVVKLCHLTKRDS